MASGADQAGYPRGATQRAVPRDQIRVETCQECGCPCLHLPPQEGGLCRCDCDGCGCAELAAGRAPAEDGPATPPSALRRALVSWFLEAFARTATKPTGVDRWSPEQLREYATALILEHARDIESLSIFEMAGEFGPTGEEISDADANEVAELIVLATITVEWPEVSE